MLQVLPPVLQSVTVFEVRAFKEMINLQKEEIWTHPQKDTRDVHA